MSRDSHDRPVSVLHQHIIGDPDGDLLVVGGVDRLRARIDPSLLTLRASLLALDQIGREGGLYIGIDLGLVLGGRDLGDEWVLRSQDHESGAEERVGAGGEHLQLLRVTDDRELDVGALGTADPVPLQSLRRIGPVDPLQVVEQPLDVVGDLEEPLLEVALGDLGPAALATPVNDLLVGQHCLAGGAPVDGRLAPLPQLCLVELEEDPLGPLVVLGLGDVDDAIPVVHEPHALQLAREVRDVLGDQLRGVDAALQGEVLRVDPEGIEPDRLEHVGALEPNEAAEDVRAGESVDVADVEALRGGIGVHHQVVKRTLGRVQIHPMSAALLPAPSPLRLDLGRVVPLSHRTPWASRRATRREKGGPCTRPAS